MCVFVHVHGRLIRAKVEMLKTEIKKIRLCKAKLLLDCVL